MKNIKNSKRILKNNTLNIKNSKNISGLKLFHIGILLLAAAPSISFLLLTISSILEVLKEKTITSMINIIFLFF